MLRLEKKIGQFWKVIILYWKLDFTEFWYKLILHLYQFYISTEFTLELILGHYQF